MAWMWAVALADATCIPARYSDQRGYSACRDFGKPRLNFLGIKLDREPSWLRGRYFASHRLSYFPLWMYQTLKCSN